LQDVDCDVEIEEYDEWFNNYEEFDGLHGEMISIREQQWLTNKAFTGVPVPKISRTAHRDLSPCSMLVVKYIQNMESRKLLHVLFDSGASHTMIHSSCLPVGMSTHLLPSMVKCQTIAGTLDSSCTVRLREILLPEWFDKTKIIYGKKAHVFDAKCNYDVILGRDVLSDIGLILNFETNTVKWMDREITMKPRNHWKDHENIFALLTQTTEELIEEPESYILDVTYEKYTAKEISDQQTHLSAFEQQRLTTVLKKYDTLFNGELGHYPHRKIHS
jgi:hypothetical protein